MHSLENPQQELYTNECFRSLPVLMPAVKSACCGERQCSAVQFSQNSEPGHCHALHVQLLACRLQGRHCVADAVGHVYGGLA